MIEVVEETKIPKKIFHLIERMEKLFDVELYYSSEIYLYNRGGWPYAKGEGFVYSVCTSSFADGPDDDFSEEIKEIMLHSGFGCEEDGDNGMDPLGSYCRDTYWHYRFIYKPSIEDLD